jgi:hypothetical protein
MWEIAHLFLSLSFSSPSSFRLAIINISPNWANTQDSGRHWCALLCVISFQRFLWCLYTFAMAGREREKERERERVYSGRDIFPACVYGFLGTHQRGLYIYIL